MPDYEQLLLRADEETLKLIVGAPVVRLLNLLDPRLASPAELRQLAAELWTPAEVLRRAEVRRSLLETLSPPEARSMALQLGLDPGDAFGALGQWAARRFSNAEKQLFASLGVADPEPAVTPTPASAEAAGAAFGLFSHQRAAARQVLEVLNGKDRRVLLHMPTGSGKTRTAMHVVAQILRDHEPAVVTWLAYSEELCSQAADEFAAAWRNLGDRDVNVYRHWGRTSVDLGSVTDGFVVAGLGKTYIGAKARIQPLLRLSDRCKLVVIDEAHQAINETYRFVLEVLLERSEESRLLGLTATPGRTWNDPDKDRPLADFFHKQKVTLRVDGYSSPLEYLIDQGYLARPDFRNLTYSGGPDIDAGDLKRMARELELPDSVLRHLADDEQRNLLIVQTVEMLLRDHDRVLVFAATVEHSRLLAAILSARGARSAAVTADTHPAERQRLIGAFRSDGGAPMVLCNYGVLTTGFDAPRTSAAVIARPTKSLVLYSQMVGRATRGIRAGGNAEATIVTIVDTTLPGFGSLAQAFYNWEDVW